MSKVKVAFNGMGRIGKNVMRVIVEQFNDQIVSAEVYLRLDKDREKENKIAEIKLHVPGKEMFAKKQCKSFEEATNVAVEALRRQIMKEKTK